MNILIYGFGRMGLTHFSILNQLNSKFRFTIIEPNNIFRKIISNNIDAKFMSNDSELKDPFDLTLVTSPPFAHNEILLNSKNRNDRCIFIEKPFGGYQNCKAIINLDNVYIGYVLRFNPCIQWIKKNLDSNNILSIKGTYLSRTITKKPNGWRNGVYSGVLNEMGSHIIDLIFYLTDENYFDVISSQVISKVSDVDDIVKAKLKSKKGKKIDLYFNWIENVRKPVFNLEIKTKDGFMYVVDQQMIEKYDKDNKFIDKVTLIDIKEKAPFYFRGVDFTNQMEDLIGLKKNISSGKSSININNVMKKIITK